MTNTPMNLNNSVDAEVDTEVADIVEDTKQEIKTNNEAILQPKPKPFNNSEVQEKQNQEIVKDQRNKEIENSIDKSSDTEVTDEQKYIESLKIAMDKEIDEFKASNPDAKTFGEFREQQRANFASRIYRGLINGNIQNINNIYELGDDIVDYLLGDLYDTQRTPDFELIPLKKPLDERTKISQLLGGFTETQADRDSVAYGISKGLSQYLLPAFKTAGFLKSIGLKRFQAGLASTAVGTFAIDPYEDKLFNFLKDRTDLAPLIYDVLTSPEKVGKDGKLKPADERLQARLYSLANDFITGEILLPVTAKTAKGATKLSIKAIEKTGLDKASAKVLFGLRDITKDSVGKAGNEMVDFFMDQIYKIKSGSKTQRNRFVAKIRDAIQKDGTDIAQDVFNRQETNLVESLNLYMKGLKNNPLLQKYYIGGDGQSLSGVPLRGSKIQRTFNAKDLNRYFKGKKRDEAFGDKKAIVDFIMARGEAIKSQISPRSRTWNSMKTKARSQLPLDTINVMSDFIESFGKGGEFDLEASIIALNDLVNESAIVLRDLTQQMDDALVLKKNGQFDSKHYDILKNDFAFSLKFMDSLLNIKRQSIAPISRALSLSNVTSGKAPRGGLKTLLDLKEEDALVQQAARESRIQNAKDMINPDDALGEFDIEDILNLADSGDIKAVQQQIRRLNLAATNPRALKLILKAQNGTGIIKISNHLFINSILSNPITHQVNMISTGINTFGRPVAKFIGAEGNDTRLRAMKELQYLFSTMQESTKMAAFAFRANRNIVDAGASILEGKSAERLMMDGWTGTRGALGRAFMDGYGIPSRFLMAEDELFKQMNFRSYLRAEIWERTQREIERGTRKFATRAKYNEYVNKQFDSIISVINRESMEGKLSKRNLELMERARQYAAEATFTEDLRKGSVSANFQNLVNEFPIARQIVPFIRTPLNILKQSAKASPAALLAEEFPNQFGWMRKASWIDEHIREINSPDKQVRAFARGRSRMGSSLFAGGLVFAGQVDNPEAPVAITGGLPKNRHQREILLATGYQPYSIRLFATEEDIKKYGEKGTAYEVVKGENDSIKYIRGADGKIKYKYISFKRLEPYAGFLALAADTYRVGGYLVNREENKLKNEALNQVLLAAMYDSTIDKTFISGIAELFQMFEEPYRLNSFITKRIAQTYLVPFSSGQKFIKNALNTGAFGYESDGNIRMDKRVAKGEFEGDYNPLIFAQRLVNELAGLTPYGDAKARPYQNHITGKYSIVPSGFGRDEWNVLFDGWATDTVSINDPVMTVLAETGGEFAPPTDVLISEDDRGESLELDSTELASLIYATATYTKGALGLRMYDRMDNYIKNNQLLIQLMRMNVRDLEMENLPSDLKSKISTLLKITPDILEEDYNSKATRVELIHKAREKVKTDLTNIHKEYKEDAKNFWINNEFKKESPEKYERYIERKRKTNLIFDTLISDSRNKILEDFAALNLLS